MVTGIRIWKYLSFITAVLLVNMSYGFEANFPLVIIEQANDPGGETSPQYEALQKELDRLYEIEKRGGWRKIKPTKKFYGKGESATAVKLLKQRLKASGDFNSDDTSTKFTEELESAVKKVQKRFGFTENGVVDAPLIIQLNIPLSDRIDQLLVNMERLRDFTAFTSGTRLVANIPEFKLHVYEGSKEVFNMAIVVGSESNKTEIFNDEMQHIVFSPYWNVPPGIVEKEILPAMRKNRNYLRDNNYEQVGIEDGLPVIRQRPGVKNSLGLVKFVFPNSHAIYFHDTPAKSLFSVRKRTFSHGCIRLAEPFKLAQYLLRSNADWTPQKIQAAMHSGKEQTAALQTGVPVYITYFTAWVDGDGLLHLREDVYGLDKEMSKRIARS
jgi:murein L,D-transpeptidase YcbB/YkuD